MAPILSFTSEETWGYIKKKGLRTKGITSKKQKAELKNNPPESIFLSTWPKKNAEMVNEDLEKKWQQILNVRSKAQKSGWARIGLGLMIGGAGGNFWDRVGDGRVT
ncbi:unnamed protein product, partial [marine sediment metagenome]